MLQLTLILSALLCSLVAGLTLTFAIVVMPGIRALGDRDALKSFKAMDSVIQGNQPVFMLVWLGSAVTLVGATVLGYSRLEGLDLVLLSLACAIFILGVHLPTITINIPLNNRLQSMDLDIASEEEIREITVAFQTRWVRWNTIRTYVAIVTAVLLYRLLLQL